MKYHINKLWHFLLSLNPSPILANGATIINRLRLLSSNVIFSTKFKYVKNTSSWSLRNQDWQWWRQTVEMIYNVVGISEAHCVQRVTTDFAWVSQMQHARRKEIIMIMWPMAWYQILMFVEMFWIRLWKSRQVTGKSFNWK
jgi:hypothetical protein